MKYLFLTTLALILATSTVFAEYDFYDRGSCDIADTDRKFILWSHIHIATGKLETNLHYKILESNGQEVELPRLAPQGMRLRPDTIKKDNKRVFKIKHREHNDRFLFRYKKKNQTAYFKARFSGFNGPGDGIGYQHGEFSAKLKNCKFDFIKD